MSRLVLGPLAVGYRSQIQTVHLHPVHVLLVPPQEVLKPCHVNPHGMRMAQAHPRHIPHVDPLGDSEIGRFGHVEARIEAKVVRSWDGNDGVARSLDACGVFDTSLGELLWAQEVPLVAEELGTIAGGGREVTGHEGFKTGRILGADGIPVLRRASVEIVDAEEAHVFIVGSEGRCPHAKVEVGGGHSGQADMLFPVSVCSVGPQQRQA
mmetsp:Transcript_42311/g.128342  ORF Transcript_42311/g.128342 Transcript_42311/m.128342 type:complete len:209 (-) Transcript_42311:1294-1920(-)